jgi:hypothetical protein
LPSLLAFLVDLRISPLHTKFHTLLYLTQNELVRVFHHFLTTFTFNPIQCLQVILKNTPPSPILSRMLPWRVSKRFFLMSCHDHALDERALQVALPFFTHMILLDRAFAHCPRFPTAATRGSLGRALWLIIRKDQLSIIGLVNIYLTNYLISHMLINWI